VRTRKRQGLLQARTPGRDWGASGRYHRTREPKRENDLLSPALSSSKEEREKPIRLMVHGPNARPNLEVGAAHEPNLKTDPSPQPYNTLGGEREKSRFGISGSWV
jgi:hypothetical protein